MHFRFFFTAIFMLAGCLYTSAQSVLPEYGQLTREEIEMKECSFDREAEAVIIFDDAETDYDDDYRMITKRRIRIKILNEKGVDRANVVIPFYSEDDYEFIRNVQAVTYIIDASGSYTVTDLEKKSVYTEKRDKYYSFIKFAMPAVKAGCIIEYRYESIIKYYRSYFDWDFQSDLPTMKSCYMLQIVPDAEFTYDVQKRRDYRIVIKPIPDKGRIYFEMNNIAGLRFEPYMDAAKDYLQRVNFQLSGVTSRYGDKQKINTTWKSTAYDLMTDKEFGSQLDKDLKADDVKLLVLVQGSETGKMKAIYNYVRDNISWNGYEGKYAMDGLKKVLDSKRGHAGEINLLLVNLLVTNGINAYPLLVAERDFGKIDSAYPFLDRFNKTAAYVIADGKEFILDASQKNTPAGLTPYSLLNTLAFRVDKKNFALLRIGSGNRAYKSILSVNGELDAKGHLSGKAVINSYDYAREQSVGDIKENKKAFITNNFEKPYDGMAIDSFYTLNTDNDSLPLITGINFHRQLNESGGFVFINYNLFMGMEKNPFISSMRFTNVNFGFPANIAMEANIKLPANSKTDELPKNQLLANNNNTIRLSREIKLENGMLNIKIVFQRSTTLVLADNYNELKTFYKEMVDMLNEPVLVKISN